MRERGVIAIVVAALTWSISVRANAPISEDVPVPGGLAALAAAMGFSPPLRALAVADLARVAGEADQARRLTAYLEAATIGRDRRADDLVPLPLPATTWSRVVFGRPVARESLFAAVMTDRAAALLARGLTALDEETLRFFAERPERLARIHQRAAGTFAAFSGQLRVRGHRVEPPGGARAVPLWEAIVGERVGDPDRFVGSLFEARKGRVAYLYDLVGSLDPPQQRFVFGDWIANAGLRTERFRALASVAATAFPEWDVMRAPYARPPHDLLSFFLRANVTDSGAPAFLTDPHVWAAAFEAGSAGGPADAAWLAAIVMEGHGRARMVQLDRFTAGQRLLAASDAQTVSDSVLAIQAMPRQRMLVLALDRLGIARPALSASLARQADRIASLEGSRRYTAMAQFQGAIALVERLGRVGSLDRARADALLTSLAGLPFDPSSRGYGGSLASWLLEDLLPVLPADGLHSAEDRLIDALGGPAGAQPVRRIEWEGQEYIFDPVARQRGRIRAARRQQAARSIDDVLGLLARTRTGSAAAPAPESIDAALAEVLLQLAYAAEWQASRAISGSGARVAARHDFGFELRGRDLRQNAPWMLPARIFTTGVPWRIGGSLLGLDIALAPLALRRVHADPPSAAPAIGTIDRDVFVESFALLDSSLLDDEVIDAAAAAIGRGADRLARLADGDAAIDAIGREIAMDGRRARALGWALAHDRASVPDLFSTIDLLHLGGGAPAALDAAGMSSLVLLGSLRSHLARPGLAPALIGRSQSGVLASSIPDLHLRVATGLRARQLPAALARAVLAAALQDYLDRTMLSAPDDWLSFVRAARAVTDEALDDYIAAAIADCCLQRPASTAPERIP